MLFTPSLRLGAGCRNGVFCSIVRSQNVSEDSGYFILSATGGKYVEMDDVVKKSLVVNAGLDFMLTQKDRIERQPAIRQSGQCLRPVAAASLLLVDEGASKNVRFSPAGCLYPLETHPALALHMSLCSLAVH